MDDEQLHDRGNFQLHPMQGQETMQHASRHGANTTPLQPRYLYAHDGCACGKVQSLGRKLCMVESVENSTDIIGRNDARIYVKVVNIRNSIPQKLILLSLCMPMREPDPGLVLTGLSSSACSVAGHHI